MRRAMVRQTGALVVMLLALGAGCSRSKTQPQQVPAEPASVASTTAKSALSEHGPLPFIEDDYELALSRARERGLPLFVDVWAPWCHTCLSLQTYVLSDPEMAAYADRFVWLAIDTEKDKNQGFIEKFPIEAWPTLLVIDSAKEAPVLKWLGSLTADELRALLGDAATGIAQGSADGEAGAKLLEAEHAAAENKRQEAVVAYRAALVAAPAGWSKRARAVDGLQAQLARQREFAACASLASEEIPAMPKGTSLANVALSWLSCARSMTGDAGKKESERAAQTVERIARDGLSSILPDDRSSMYEELVDFRKEAGDKEGAKRAAAEWASFLEVQAKAAKDSAARAVFDAHRQLAYAAMGEPERALPVLAQTARESPRDYNAAARLAKTYLDLKRYDEALTEVDRALSLAYGPRKIRIYSLKATILLGKGDKNAARATLDEGIALGESLPLQGSYIKALESLKIKRAPL